MKRIEANGYIRVSKLQALKMFNSGENVYMCTCCILPSGSSVITINNKSRHTFEQYLNSAEYYNCNSETGKEMYFYRFSDTRFSLSCDFGNGVCRIQSLATGESLNISKAELLKKMGSNDIQLQFYSLTPDKKDITMYR